MKCQISWIGIAMQELSLLSPSTLPSRWTKLS